mmetsp:Transcript_132657/g.369833  ORF Transcript_132657/g.369833 Transcript_132657/m.369833 type:complete len:252 (+) Transcript_132657:228-983(+)
MIRVWSNGTNVVGKGGDRSVIPCTVPCTGGAPRRPLSRNPEGLPHVLHEPRPQDLHCLVPKAARDGVGRWSAWDVLVHDGALVAVPEQVRQTKRLHNVCDGRGALASDAPGPRARFQGVSCPACPQAHCEALVGTANAYTCNDHSPGAVACEVQTPMATDPPKLADALGSLDATARKAPSASGATRSASDHVECAHVALAGARHHLLQDYPSRLKPEGLYVPLLHISDGSAAASCPQGPQHEARAGGALLL